MPMFLLESLGLTDLFIYLRRLSEVVLVVPLIGDLKCLNHQSQFKAFRVEYWHCLFVLKKPF